MTSIIKGKENRETGQLKQKINIFFINYFNYLAPVLGLTIFFIGVFLFIIPQYQKISKTGQAAEDRLSTEYGIKNDYLSKIRNLREIYNSLSENDKKKINQMVPNDGNLIGLIPQVESIIVRNGAILNSIDISSPDSQSSLNPDPESAGKRQTLAGIFSGKTPAGTRVVKIDAQIESADYQVLKNILKTFEKNVRLFDIGKVTYQAKENKVNLIIYAYYLAE